MLHSWGTHLVPPAARRTDAHPSVWPTRLGPQPHTAGSGHACACWSGCNPSGLQPFSYASSTMRNAPWWFFYRNKTRSPQQKWSKQQNFEHLDLSLSLEEDVLALSTDTYNANIIWWNNYRRKQCLPLFPEIFVLGLKVACALFIFAPVFLLPNPASYILFSPGFLLRLDPISRSLMQRLEDSYHYFSSESSHSNKHHFFIENICHLFC